MHTFIIRLYAPVDGAVTGLHGLVERPGGEPLPFADSEELIGLLTAHASPPAGDSGGTSSAVGGTIVLDGSPDLTAT